MIYIGNNEISNIYIGTDEIYGIYAGDLQIYPTDFGIVTAISLENLVWVEDVPHSGGTADSGNCSFDVYAYYDSGKRRKVNKDTVISGSLNVPASTVETREMVGTLTLTAIYSGFTATGSVDAYQAALFEPSKEYLTFNILSAGTINWTASKTSIAKTIEYKLNNGEWTPITSNTSSSAPTITVNSGDKLQFRGNNTAYCSVSIYGDVFYNSFRGSASFELEGNIMSLIYGDNFKNNSAISSTYTFANLFSYCANLVSAENLILPATTLTDSCYYGMFQGCTSLTAAPSVLPATTLVQSCYYSMFRSCSSLTTAPELPATTLASNCYYYMFEGCVSLTTVPSNYLPANTLVDGCYVGMFQNCKSLTTAPELPATTLAERCYSYMFDGCTSLTRAPELPVATLANNCYQGMFQNCTSLNYIKCLATDISATDCTWNWVGGVASTGTFVKNPDMASWTTGDNGIPEGWTVIDNS